MIGEEPVIEKGTGCSVKNCRVCPFVDGCLAIYELEMRVYIETNLEYVKSLKEA